LLGTGIFAARADLATVAPPEDSTPVLDLVADGVQIDTCDAKDGGSAPSTGCDASHLSQQVRIHCSATYPVLQHSKVNA
jgi:hypothetical protein